jgi:hypothetical protein
MRVVGLLAAVACALDGGTAVAQTVVTHPDVVFFPVRPTGDLLVPRDDAVIAVHPEYAYPEGTPARVTSAATGVLPTGSSVVGCPGSTGLERREVWRVHFQPNVDARSAGVLAFGGGRSVGVSHSETCITMTRSPLGGLDLPAGALSFGLESEDGLWMSASGQFFALTFLAAASEIDDMRVFTVVTVEEGVDVVAACHGTDTTDFMVELGASTPDTVNVEIALLAVGATGCNLAGVACTPAAGGLFVCPATRMDLVRITCSGGTPARTIVLAAPAAEGDIDSDPTSNVCEVTDVAGMPDGGTADGGVDPLDGGVVTLDGSVMPGRDGAVVLPDGATRNEAGVIIGRDSGRRDDPPIGGGGGGPSFQGGGGCVCATAGDPSSLAWALLLGLWIARRSRVR